MLCDYHFERIRRENELSIEVWRRKLLRSTNVLRLKENMRNGTEQRTFNQKKIINTMLIK
jgi:hypothetical protein